ncbi:MAG: ABC transporter [Gammaproteobacteria bacterium RIFCSPHIGHO2_12_FULL_41_20]|nr:MAG: ABC transporter [Gammaproteobacteria bacterium RIFCSPHIGHO2_12_FULL_41_20]
MFRPAAIFIGLRYTRAKRRNHFISFISFMSIAGIVLGVAVLITVLSVMNGFDREIKKRVFGMVPAITISSVTGYLANWQELQTTLEAVPEITGSAPFVTAQVLLAYSGGVQPAVLNGILPNEEQRVSELPDKIVLGSLSALRPGQFGVVLGEELASRLNVTLGDKVTVVTPQVALTPAGVIPRFKRFTVVGLFRAGSGFGFDSSMGFIHLSDAQKLLGLGSNVTGLQLSIRDIYVAPRVSEQLMQQLTPSASISNWTNQFGAFFHAVSLEKTMMFFILLLIIAVAAFNLVSTLVMVVNDKERDIAILRTFGATPRTIMAIFMVQGGIIGLLGTLLGVLVGIELAWHVTEIVHWIEGVFHVQFLSSGVYFVDYLPSELQWGDVWRISVTALGLSLLATIYPAWRAANTEPVEALRYE